MSFTIEFTNPRFEEQKYLEEKVLPQEGLEECAGRIILGCPQGIAYTLFSDTDDRLPFSFSSSSIYSIEFVTDYLNDVQEYITDAREHTEKHGFGLVTVSKNRYLEITEYDCKDNLLKAGLGSSRIESAEKFRAFLEMIESGKGKLDKQYERIVEKAKSFVEDKIWRNADSRSFSSKRC